MDEAFVSYSVDNDNKFRAAIKQAYADVGNLTIPFKLIDADFYRSEKAIFQLGSRGQYPDFGGINPTSKKTEAARRRKRAKWGHDYPLLKASGTLERSMTDPRDANAINYISPDGSALEIGTTLPYGAFHQSDRPRKKIPQRKFLFIGPEAPQFANSDQVGRLTRWLSIINGYVMKKLEVMGDTKGG